MNKWMYFTITIGALFIQTNTDNIFQFLWPHLPLPETYFTSTTIDATIFSTYIFGPSILFWFLFLKKYYLQKTLPLISIFTLKNQKYRVRLQLFTLLFLLFLVLFTSEFSDFEKHLAFYLAEFATTLTAYYLIFNSIVASIYINDQPPTKTYMIALTNHLMLFPTLLHLTMLAIVLSIGIFI
jgi:hypothetical protein